MHSSEWIVLTTHVFFTIMKCIPVSLFTYQRMDCYDYPRVFHNNDIHNNEMYPCLPIDLPANGLL